MELYYDQHNLAVPLKPFRDRTEAYVFDSRAGELHLYCGYFEDGSIGVPGGGVDDGEDVRDAALREWFEETGNYAHRPTLIKLAPFKLCWNSPYASAEQEKRAAVFCGSSTQFVAAALEKAGTEDPQDPSNLDSPGFRPVGQVLAELNTWLAAPPDIEPETDTPLVSLVQHICAKPVRYRLVQQRRRAIVAGIVRFENEGGADNV